MADRASMRAGDKSELYGAGKQINAAGGFNDFADQKRVRLLRGNEAKVYDVRQFRRDPGLDPKLQPGDKIEVPQSFF